MSYLPWTWGVCFPHTWTLLLWVVHLATLTQSSLPLTTLLLIHTSTILCPVWRVLVCLLSPLGSSWSFSSTGWNFGERDLILKSASRRNARRKSWRHARKNVKLTNRKRSEGNAIYSSQVLDLDIRNMVRYTSMRCDYDYLYIKGLHPFILR